MERSGNSMKLLVLGASGGCGSWICKLASERGHHVRALVRPSTRYDPPAGVEVIEGNVLDKSTLKAALQGREGVLSALGIQRKSPLNPWSAIESPHDLTASVAKDLIKWMPEEGIRRIVAISAAGVGDSISNVNPMIRWMIRHSNMAVSYKDLAEMEQVFRESGLNWAAVRPTTLTDGEPTFQVREVDRYGLLSRIPRGDVANRMLDLIESVEPISNRTPMIAS